jgi:hypothetical protein
VSEAENDDRRDSLQSLVRLLRSIRRSEILGRLRWACGPRRAHAKDRTARWRLLWHDFVVHGMFNRGGERCQDCGHDYPAWRASDEDWYRVVGGPGGLLCPACFGDRQPQPVMWDPTTEPPTQKMIDTVPPGMIDTMADISWLSRLDMLDEFGDSDV